MMTVRGNLILIHFQAGMIIVSVAIRKTRKAFGENLLLNWDQLTLCSIAVAQSLNIEKKVLKS